MGGGGGGDCTAQPAAQQYRQPTPSRAGKTNSTYSTFILPRAGYQRGPYRGGGGGEIVQRSQLPCNMDSLPPAEQVKQTLLTLPSSYLGRGTKGGRIEGGGGGDCTAQPAALQYGQPTPSRAGKTNSTYSTFILPRAGYQRGPYRGGGGGEIVQRSQLPSNIDSLPPAEQVKHAFKIILKKKKFQDTLVEQISLKMVRFTIEKIAKFYHFILLSPNCNFPHKCPCQIIIEVWGPKSSTRLFMLTILYNFGTSY